MTSLPTSNLQLQAQQALAESAIFALRDLQVECTGDSLLVSGTVDSFYHKQLAQEVVRTVVGSLDVVNRVAVRGDS